MSGSNTTAAFFGLAVGSFLVGWWVAGTVFAVMLVATASQHGRR